MTIPGSERPMTRDELIELVTAILRPECSEEELDELVWQFVQNVPHPHASDMIFWPDKKRTVEEIVDESLAWQPGPGGETNPWYRFR